MRCKDYLKARKRIERLSLIGGPEQTLEKLRLPSCSTSC